MARQTQIAAIGAVAAKAPYVRRLRIRDLGDFAVAANGR
jgi:hypothetical protein